MKLHIPHLEADEDLRDLLYHLKGICEFRDILGRLLEQLDSELGNDLEAAQNIATQIEVEVYAHLQHHTDELTVPLRDLLKSLWGSLEGSMLGDSTDIRHELPLNLRSAAFWAGQEAAWPRSEAVEVIDRLCTRGLAVSGIEVWLLAEGGVEIPSPFIYTWALSERGAREGWVSFAQHSGKEATAYVREFEWDPADHSYQGRDPLFCLDFFSEEEADVAGRLAADPGP